MILKSERSVASKDSEYVNKIFFERKKLINKKKKNLTLPIKILRRAILSFFELLALPLYYLIGIFPRNKRLWIFGAWMGQKYSDNSRAFFEYVNKNHPEIKTVWVSRNKDVVKMLRKKSCNAVSSTSLRFILYALQAGKVFSSTGSEFSLYFLHGSEHYALWHGMPLKKILNDDTNSNGEIASKKFLQRTSLIFLKLFPWRRFLEQKKLFTITNSDFFVPFLSSAFGLSQEKILRTGSPRTDNLFSHRKEKLIEEIRERFPEDKIILYMPTFRTAEWTGEVYNPFDEKYGFDLDEFLATLKRHKSVLVYKPHFYDARFMQTVRQKTPDTLSRFITVGDSDYDELYNFVGQVDILMTDYSSIYFDFIATKKPAILLPFDYEFYVKYARGHYFDYWKNIEGEKAKNWQEFYKILEEKTYASVSEETCKKFAEYVDGKACERLWKEITENKVTRGMKIGK